MIIYFRSLSEVGIYNAILPTAILFAAIGASVANVLLPVASEMIAKKKQNHLRIGVKLIQKYLSLV